MKELQKRVKQEVEKAVKQISNPSFKIKSGVKTFRQEFNKAINTALLAAFGFLIALVWKDVIQEWVTKIAESSPLQGKLISAVIVTGICVIGVIIVTRIFKIKNEAKAGNLE